MSLILISSFRGFFNGQMGSLIIILSHGFISSGIFYGLGLIYYRLFTRNIRLMSGVNFFSPLFNLWWFIVIILNIGFPPSLRFFSELFIFSRGLFFNFIFFPIFIIIIFFSSVYRVNLIIYIASSVKKNKHFKELNLIEHLIFFCHVYFMLFFSLNI